MKEKLEIIMQTIPDIEIKVVLKDANLFLTLSEADDVGIRLKWDIWDAANPILNVIMKNKRNKNSLNSISSWVLDESQIQQPSIAPNRLIAENTTKKQPKI